MKNADDVVWRVPPHRNPLVLRLDQVVKNLLLRLVGVDYNHVLAVNHHVTNAQFRKVEDAAQHIAVFTFDSAFPVMDFDCSANFLMRLDERFGLGALDAHQPQQAPYDNLNETNNGGEDAYGKPEKPCHIKRKAIGARDC